MNYSKILTYDTANAYGFSVSLWVSGCDKKCKGCFNPEAWDYSYGRPFTEETTDKIIKELNKPFIDKFVILGGEPLSPRNRNIVLELCRKVKEKVKKTIEIIIYSGYTREELQLTNEETKYLDILIDGAFDINNKVKSPDYRGSTNQKCWRRGELGWYDYSDFYFKTETSIVTENEVIELAKAKERE